MVFTHLQDFKNSFLLTAVLYVSLHQYALTSTLFLGDILSAKRFQMIFFFHFLNPDVMRNTHRLRFKGVFVFCFGLVQLDPMTLDDRSSTHHGATLLVSTRLLFLDDFHTDGRFCIESLNLLVAELVGTAPSFIQWAWDRF